MTCTNRVFLTCAVGLIVMHKANQKKTGSMIINTDKPNTIKIEYFQQIIYKKNYNIIVQLDSIRHINSKRLS